MNYTQNEKIEQVTDSKDPKTIAKLVVDGRYSIPYMPEGIYAEIRDLVYSRDRIMKQHNISANRIQRWLAIYFPEYLGLYTRFDAISGLAVLEKAPLPKDMIALGGGIGTKSELYMLLGFQHGLSLRRTEDKYRLGIY